MGRAARFPVDIILNIHKNQIDCSRGDYAEYFDGMQTYLRSIYQVGNENQFAYDTQRKRYYDKQRLGHRFRPGDVVTRQVMGKVGKRRKFAPKWKGLFIVVSVYKNTCVLKSLASGDEVTVNARQLKIFHVYVDQLL